VLHEQGDFLDPGSIADGRIDGGDDGFVDGAEGAGITSLSDGVGNHAGCVCSWLGL